MRKFFSLVLLLPSLFLLNACTYFMFWQVSKYDYDDTKADRQSEEMEQERAIRMQASGSYNDVEFGEVTKRSSVGQGKTTRPLTLEELREQQRKERAERQMRKR